ncbi:TonB-dependent receptor plug domain-containing protein [Brevundimonas kwangchunensis]|uniref:TonB-dependent receptor plug domain-containing protein n=1 Tax=Brevundimonas kwangchunensis TaxID=322163 RepID=A0ABN1GVE2_9CAUL
MLLVTTALYGLMAGSIQAAPVQQVRPAQTTPPQQQSAPAATAVDDEEAYDLGTTTVTGARPRGAVDTDIPADVTLSAEQIQAYGASNIAELMTYLEPLTRSSSGRTDLQPVFLVNGRRISGFREIMGIPTEAIERTDILPEEVALQFGYRAEQRVVNFVLKNNFNSLTSELTTRRPTQGGRTVGEIEGNILRIAGANRWSMDLEHENVTPLFESERDITRERVAGDPGTEDIGAYRTLMAETERTTVRGTMKRDLNSTTQGTISASLQDNSSRSFNGFPGVSLTIPSTSPFSTSPDPQVVQRYIQDADSLRRRTDTLTAELGVLLDGFIGEDWRWTFSTDYNRVETDTTTGRGYLNTPFQNRLNANDPTANPFGTFGPWDFGLIAPDTANSVSQSLAAELVLNGDVFELPAGGVSSTFKVGADTRSLDSTSTRYNAQTGAYVLTDRSQSRDRGNVQASFSIPIASRRREVLTGLGDLSVNLNAGYEELSDFGGLNTFGLGVNWSPIEQLSFLVNYTDEQGAPSIGQLNDPIITTPNTPVFDFRTGQTVLVNQITGGNPDLNADNRTVLRTGVTLRPFSERDFSVMSTWTYSRTDDYLASFPAITEQLEAALPGRFVRDTDGNLLSVDSRPLNFQKYERQDLRTGINYSQAFGTPTPQSTPLPGQPGSARPPVPGGGGVMIISSGGPGAGPPPGGGGQFRMGGGPGGPGGGRRFSMQPGQGRFNLSLYHTYRFVDEITIADGLPTLDLLDGDATSTRGGTSRNEIQLQGGVFRNGFGAFMNANWREGTRINGTTGPDLEFSDQTTVNLNVFMDLNQRTSWIEKYPILRGSRLQLGVQNIFDTRLEVTSSDGDTPLNYQPDYLDPQGRVVSLTFRKILF